MHWLIALHIISFVCWFAGLFYLPRLFVYHAMTKEKAVSEQLKVMEHKLYYYIMWPAMAATYLTGFSLLVVVGYPGLWFTIKLIFVGLLTVYHFFCDYYLHRFDDDKNEKSHKFFRMFNEVPTIGLIVIVILAVVRPF